MPGGPHSVGLVLSNPLLTHSLVIDNVYRLSSWGGSVTVMYVREGLGPSFLTAGQLGTGPPALLFKSAAAKCSHLAD